MPRDYLYWRQSRRANTAPWRWFGVKGGGPDVTPPILEPQGKPTLFDYQRRKRRSAQTSYQFYAARQIDLLFQPEGKVHYPDIANTWRLKRAAPSAYWRPNTGQIVYIDFPEELFYKPIPVGYWKPLRAAASAYWRDNFGPIPVVLFPEELSVKAIPNRAPAARRGANAAYFVSTKLIEPTVAFPEELRPSTFPVRARGPQRASQFAYWMPPPFLVQFPPSLEPLIIGKGRALTLHATDRDFIIPAKRRVFDRKPKRP